MTSCAPDGRRIDADDVNMMSLWHDCQCFHCTQIREDSDGNSIKYYPRTCSITLSILTEHFWCLAPYLHIWTSYDYNRNFRLSKTRGDVMVILTKTSNLTESFRSSLEILSFHFLSSRLLVLYRCDQHTCASSKVTP